MGSVQSEIVCPKCKYPQAFEDYYYKTGEVFIFCGRCGYSYSVFMKHDPAFGRKIKAETEALLKQGKIDEALKVSGNEGWVSHRTVDGKDVEVPISEWSDEEKISYIKATRWETFHKRDQNGNMVWNIEKTGGFGAYMHRRRGIGSGGSFTSKWGAKKLIKNMINHMKKSKQKKESITYTKKICGKWFEFDARTGTKAPMEGEIHDDGRTN